MALVTGFSCYLFDLIENLKLVALFQPYRHSSRLDSLTNSVLVLELVLRLEPTSVRGQFSIHPFQKQLKHVFDPEGFPAGVGFAA